MKTRYLRILTLISVLCCLSISAKAQHIPGDTLPDRWQYYRQYDQTLPTDDKWWLTFNDSILTQLITLGETANFDVRISSRRIEIARRNIQEAKSGYFPTFTASAGYDKERNKPGMYSLGVQMNWEIDIFGRISKAAKQADADWKVSKAEYAGAMVSMAANIAKLYFDLRTNQRLLQVLNEHVQSQEKIVHITEVRYKTGLSSLLDVTQARTVLYNTQASIPQIEGKIQSDINAIALLVGEYPEGVQGLLENPQPQPECNQHVSIGTPADILRRRPDIVEAERNLASYAASIGIAQKDFLPTLQLNGSIGTASEKIDGLFGKNSLAWSVSPSLNWTIFDGMARKYRVKSAEKQMQIGLDNYNLTVMTAVEEVDNALGTYNSCITQIAFLQDAMAQSSQSLDLSLELYKKGINPFTDVMNAQVSYLESQSALVTAKGNALLSLTELYQALGGGFSTDF